ncbi:hypothetical protein [Paraurantiacibacter namhicola]|uniref:Uncharacterized protein n=1 Tax=Paraurantiacibacter namhicola TaxID=645517 RepID=A0A1C7DAW7_9SPHN|nr:hypothetical protein [Paraurantiacibacter namhicola]ANU08640.1 hypothetical protein A6F65_02357 [Paraurantiacibacter namhicola]
MSAQDTTRRGKPLVVLATLTLCWVGVRALTWEGIPLPQDMAEMPATMTFADMSRSSPADVAIETAPHAAQPAEVAAQVAGTEPPLPREQKPLPVSTAPTATAFAPAERWTMDVPASPTMPIVQPHKHDPATMTPQSREPMQPRVAAGHTMMLAAAFSQSTLPPELLAFLAPGSLLGAPEPAARQGGFASASAADVPLIARTQLASRKRWSVDAWAFWRQDTTTPITSGRASYGRSQAGAVIRYRPFPGSRWQPAIHLRGSWALDGAREREAALGVSARPVPGVPVALAAEGRLFDGPAGTELRPAAFAVTQLPAADLPLGLRGEAYAAGGYVGGREATPFLDGQARLEAKVFDLADRAKLRVGAGTWGGAQSGVERLDVGPTASVQFRIGPVQGRASADYRLRVAGDVEPSSGPALTISAGF